jgi:hypothetical protein
MIYPYAVMPPGCHGESAYVCSRHLTADAAIDEALRRTRAFRTIGTLGCRGKPEYVAVEWGRRGRFAPAGDPPKRLDYETEGRL